MKSGFTLAEIDPIYARFTIALIIFLIYFKNHRSQIAFIHVAVIIMTSQATIGGLPLCYKSPVVDVISPQWRQRMCSLAHWLLSALQLCQLINSSLAKSKPTSKAVVFTLSRIREPNADLIIFHKIFASNLNFHTFVPLAVVCR
jgi:hypothetical protein